MLALTICLIFPLCLATAGFTDLFEMKIPNAIPLLMIAGFMLATLATGLPIATVGQHLLAGLIVFIACFAMFAIGVMGGGDAKLLTAAALWFGMTMGLVQFMIMVAIAGGLLTLAILLIRNQANTLMALRIPLPRSITMEKKIPYGIAIAIGGFLTATQSPLIEAALKSANL
ncbi:prepilin peptidase [Allorhizobium sp. BGMRC 0089]|uniref:A24 family peptidase n=1 Tax=Allorhizobium sonneratiae TaxID=2934936 RepID=UPI00203423C9|nr:prepilin peptidase [Allorhizobium sonneratiae]MCM2291785.1 prepilin peptidase [Allorhizobium sonneratiae]